MTNPAKPRLVFVAALEREIATLVSGRGWHVHPELLARKIHLFEHRDAIVVCAGMGASRAALAAEAALALGPATELISVGFAGACNAQHRVADVIHVDVVVDAKTGERFSTNRERKLVEDVSVLVTVNAPAGVREKGRLNASYQASAVDMEAAAVARMARMRELPFNAIKAISDEADFELPQMTKFATPDGQFREAAFGLHVATRPGLWGPVLKMAKGSKLAAAHLHIEMEGLIAQYSQNRNSRL